MVMQRWEPFGDIVSLRDAMDRLFEQSVVRPQRASSGAGVGLEKTMPVDVYEKDSDFVIRAYIPGVKAEDVEISAEREVVSIRAHIPGEIEREEARSWKWLAAELSYGDVTRVLAMPAPVDAGKMEAQVEQGVLTVVVPKAEEAKPKRIAVKAK